MKDLDPRRLKERRKRPTPALSQYTFFGHRKMFRRRSDQEKGGYVDQYSSSLFFLLVSMAGLNILDAFFTMMILDDTGWEVNPVVRSVIAVHGNKFWIWKFVLVSFCLVLLCLHSKFRLVKEIIVGLGLIYLSIVLYQIYLLMYA